MAENKRYFWLKLKEDFFKQKHIKKLRKVAGGDTYVIIYQQLLLASLQDNAMIFYDETEQDIEEQISIELDEKLDNVKITLAYLEQNKLIERGQSQDIRMIEAEHLISSESASTIRSRRFRDRKALQCNVDATQVQRDRHAEKEKEKEKEKDIELEKELQLEEGEEKNTSSEIQQIVSFCEENGFGVMNSVNLEDLRHNLDKFGFDLLKRALSIAARDHKPLSYANGCLKKWENANIKTIDDVDKLEQEYQNKKASVAKVPAYKNRGKVVPEPSWSKPDYNELMTDEEVEAFKREIEEMRNG